MAFLRPLVTTLALGLLAAAQSNTQAGAWKQCGGSSWNGPTSCVQGYVCAYYSSVYSQCVPPDVAPSVPAPTATASPTGQNPPAQTSDPPFPFPSATALPGCITLPENLSAKPNQRLPDPFMFYDGVTRVTNMTDWSCRRSEISQLFQSVELGTIPVAPDTVTASMSAILRVVEMALSPPSSHWEGPTFHVPADVAIISLNNDEIALHNGTSDRGTGIFYDLYGKDHPASAMMAWAWGVSRLIDGLAKLPAAKIDTDRLAITGCGANGKGALVVGAFEERIALTIPIESGSGGAAQANVWFSRAFDQQSSAPFDLPFDHHMLAALIAPRGLLVLDNSEFSWLGPASVFGCMKSASKVYEAIGYPDSMGFSQVGHTDHCVFPGEQYVEYQAFTDKPNNSGYVEKDWVDWAVPNLVAGSAPPTAPNEPPPTPTGVNCVVPTDLPVKKNSRLPNPFSFATSASPLAVNTSTEWYCRREQIGQLFQRYELGTLEPRPQYVAGEGSGTSLKINVGHNNRNISFDATVQYPTSDDKGPFPFIIALGGSTIPQPADTAVITFDPEDLAMTDGLSSRGNGKFYDIYGSGHSASALMVWAWGVSRIIDAVATTPLNLERGAIAVTGCSAHGRGALVAGAFDQRIHLTIPIESGAGGAGCWRIADDLKKSGVNATTAADLVNENVFFSEAFSEYADHITDLPIDHHLLAAMVAPRGLLILENRRSTNPWVLWTGWGMSQIGHTTHCQFAGQQYPELNAFVNKFLRDISGEQTNYFKTDAPNDAGYEEGKWVDWVLPRL
ncbi:hypothetical protein DFP72DRAFT_850210 [Ephemerocybe angulata]|uniref:(4-O-methyl)-D-glucuronate--lignin esterase n=1 Tax=Ephemerocybe angulata TaxID=980116 RepID=A0A8H6HUI9_9AGAR|nr:hypothetical protein DFP72DRAFT_850210 [Tulosesus angulatus]